MILVRKDKTITIRESIKSPSGNTLSLMDNDSNLFAYLFMSRRGGMMEEGLLHNIEGRNFTYMRTAIPKRNTTPEEIRGRIRGLAFLVSREFGHMKILIRTEEDDPITRPRAPHIDIGFNGIYGGVYQMTGSFFPEYQEERVMRAFDNAFKRAEIRIVAR